MTTTCATVQTSWATKIFAHANIKALTEKVIYHPYTQTSEREIEDLYFGAEVNFIQCIVYRVIELVMTQSEITTFNVALSYYRQQEPVSTNYATTRSFFDVLYPLVKSELGQTWDGNVDYFNLRTDDIIVEEATIDGTPCWYQSAIFEGVLSQSY